MLKKMKDPVKGTARVVDSMAGLLGTKGTMRLILVAEGVPPTSVEFSSFRHQERWPTSEVRSIPVTVDRSNPQNFRIEWDEIPKAGDINRQETDKREQQLLAELRGEPSSDTGSRGGPLPTDDTNADAAGIWKEAVQALVEARKTWRENLERGDVTREQFEKEMRNLDPDFEEARRELQGFVDSGDLTQDQFEAQIRRLNNA